MGAAAVRNVTMIGNNTGISRVFSNRTTKKSQRAFVHWYVGEGMKEGEDLGFLEKDYLLQMY